MLDLSALSTLHATGRYFDVVLALFDVPDNEFDQILSTGELPLLLQLASDCSEALRLPALGARIYLRAIHVLRRQQGEVDAASVLDRALTLWPEDAALHLDCALFFAEAKQAGMAERHYRRAIDVKPEDPTLLLSYANFLSSHDRDDEAEANCKKVLLLNPALHAAHNNLANLYKRQKRNVEAEHHYHSAIAMKPNFYEGHFNYGVFLQGTERLDEAAAAYRRAITVDPSQASAYNNLGSVLLSLGRPEVVAEAERAYALALALNPEDADRRVNLAILRLTQGRLAEAWPDYEARDNPSRKERMTFPPPYDCKRWQGQALAGKSILVWREQGLGDQIMFARYLVKLKALGASRVVFGCSAPLKSLFSGLAGVDLLVGDKDAVPNCDYWTYLISLPLHFNTVVATIPAEVPYLSPQTAQINALQPLLERQSGVKVGICWRGSTAYPLERQRSPGLDRFTPLFDTAGVRFFCLLPASRDEFLASAGSAGVDLGHEVDADTPPFAETAALMQQLDLVITSDTSIAHLAGALGKPTWVLLSNPAYWTWMLEREDSPWYPSMRLFRQPAAGDWDDVFERVREAMQELVSDAPALPNVVAPALLAPIAAGELLDKISILQIKSERIQDPAKLKNIHQELAELQAVAKRAGLAPAAQERLDSLRAVNQELWVIEDDIRECERRQDFGPKFVALARSVYFTNDRRAALKREINDLSGSTLVEEKSYASY
jgi:Tfp pilus assembly protein PilF